MNRETNNKIPGSQPRISVYRWLLCICKFETMIRGNTFSYISIIWDLISKTTFFHKKYSTLQIGQGTMQITFVPATMVKCLCVWWNIHIRFTIFKCTVQCPQGMFTLCNCCHYLAPDFLIIPNWNSVPINSFLTKNYFSSSPSPTQLTFQGLLLQPPSMSHIWEAKLQSRLNW